MRRGPVEAVHRPKRRKGQRRADLSNRRLPQGKSLSSGAAIGQAARVKRHQALFEVRTTLDGAKRAKEALWKASMKVAMPCYIRVAKGEELLTS